MGPDRSGMGFEEAVEVILGEPTLQLCSCNPRSGCTLCRGEGLMVNPRYKEAAVILGMEVPEEPGPMIKRLIGELRARGVRVDYEYIRTRVEKPWTGSWMPKKP